MVVCLFVCPLDGGKVAKLHLPAGRRSFASRGAHKLAYRSQRVTAWDRAITRMFKLRAHLGADGGMGDYIPKPKGIHGSRYERELEKVAAAEAVCDANMSAMALRFGVTLEER